MPPRVLRTYRDDTPERLPLSRQREFKSIKNIVIREAVRLGELSSVFCDDGIDDDLELADADYDPPMEDDVSGPHVNWSDRYKQVWVFLYGSEDVPRDHGKAFQLLTAEALAGNVLAMHDLGQMLARRHTICIQTLNLRVRPACHS